jgi:hypothetical protein
MSSTPMSTGAEAGTSAVATVPMRFEVTSLPVTDIDRAKALFLIVEDIIAARDALIGHGAEVSEIWHSAPAQPNEPGPDPERRSYLSYASFADPDGNVWQLQEITQRLPGRD